MAVAQKELETRLTPVRRRLPISERGKLSTTIPIKPSVKIPNIPSDEATITIVEMLGRNPGLTDRERLTEVILDLHRSDPNFSRTFFGEDKTLTEPQLK